MRRILLEVAYDGTDFGGFQRQADGLPTIQGELERALLELTGEAVKVVGAGRTDAGVHARGQMVHLDTLWPGPVERLPRILGNCLPAAIAVRRAFVVEERFHARYGARFRRYAYALLLGGAPDPLQERFAWRVPSDLNLAAMRDAAELLRGCHDFTGFVSNVKTEEQKNPVRCVQRIRWWRRGRRWILIIQADGFLRHMVRNMMGSLAEVGQGKLERAEFGRILETGDRRNAPVPAPASGLCLLKVGYGSGGSGPSRRSAPVEEEQRDEDLRSEGR